MNRTGPALELGTAASGADELKLLLDVLPEPLRDAVLGLPPSELLEVIMDLGRLPEARLASRVVPLANEPVNHGDIATVVTRVGDIGRDNRAGIERTLHRISAIRNRRGEVVGLTLRVGRAVVGTIDMIRDLVESGLNLLLLGRPGVGKTTKLREVARVLADDFARRVVVVDTSNEIGGDGDVPHAGIGSARRMQVAVPELQHDVMIEAVENHMPEVIIVDEIGTSAEAAAARTIAERGVQLIATAHGNTLENLVLNPTLSDLVGGVHTVTLGDEEARRRRTAKTINERKSPPTFDIVVEIVNREEVLVHRDTAEAVDRLLAGSEMGGERRRLVDGGVQAEQLEPVEEAVLAENAFAEDRPVRIYAYALSRELLGRVLREMPFLAELVVDANEADVIVALRSRANDYRLRQLTNQGVSLLPVKRNSTSDMRRAMKELVASVSEPKGEQVREAVRETEHAIDRVMSEGVAVALAPRPSELRSLQHRMIERYHLQAESRGQEPLRHLVIHPQLAE